MSECLWDLMKPPLTDSRLPTRFYNILEENSTAIFMRKSTIYFGEFLLNVIQGNERLERQCCNQLIPLLGFSSGPPDGALCDLPADRSIDVPNHRRLIRLFLAGV